MQLNFIIIIRGIELNLRNLYSIFGISLLLVDLWLYLLESSVWNYFISFTFLYVFIGFTIILMVEWNNTRD